MKITYWLRAIGDDKKFLNMNFKQEMVDFIRDWEITEREAKMLINTGNVRIGEFMIYINHNNYNYKRELDRLFKLGIYEQK